MGNYLDRVHVGLDYFDASINRLAAWTIGIRNMQRALLIALLEPTEKLQRLELMADYTARLALFESIKSLPFGAVWNYFCETRNAPTDDALLAPIRSYEAEVLSKR